MTELFDRRREWVNTELGDKTRGKKITPKNRIKLMRKLWRQAKKNIK